MRCGTIPRVSTADVYNLDCPSRQVLDRIAGKWTVLIVGRLAAGTMRFSELHRAVPGISHKVLTQMLRALERDGLLTRRVYAVVPPRVEYSLTDLGRTLLELVELTRGWAERHLPEIESARARHDAAERPADGVVWSVD